MALADFVYRLKPEAGDTTPHDELGVSGDLSGDGTIALTDRGGGDFAWRVSAGAVSAAAPSRALVGTTDGTGVTVAITLKVVTYPTVDFTGLVGYSPDTTVTSGLYLGQNGANNLRARWVSAINAALGVIGTAEVTWVLRMRTSVANADDRLAIWKTTIGRTGSAADIAPAGQNITSTTLDTLVVNAASSAVVEIKDWVIWHEELSDADCAAVADDLRGTLDGGGGSALDLDPGTLALSGSLSISGDIASVVKKWRVPTTAAESTSVHVVVLSGTSPTYTIAAQGTATVDASGNADIAATGTIGTKALAFVHNYDDDDATTSINGGAGIAELVNAG